MSVTILNHDLLMSENLERMDTVHSNEKYKKKSSWISIKSKWNRKNKSHQLHKHMFATVPIYCIHRGIIFPIIREG